MWPADLEYIYSKLNNNKVKTNFPDQTKPLIFQEVIDFGNVPITLELYVNYNILENYSRMCKL